MRLSTRSLTAVGLGLLLGAAACSDEELFPPGNRFVVDPLFERYVSMGNSITAGFQSGGINEATQVQSYAVLLANAMGTTFYAPLMNVPGCPALYTNVFTQTRASAIPCALRKVPPVPPPYINNTAVPGAEVIDIYNNLDPSSNANALTTFFLGGLTQTQMMQRVQPTFVTVWIGNNDVLGAATNSANGGDSTLITPVATFTANYTAMLDSIDDAGPNGGVLVGVANVTSIPFFSAGAVYWAIDNGLVPGASFPPTMVVNANCAPSTVIPGARGDSTLVPFPYGGLLLATAAAGAPAVLDCSDGTAQIVAPAEVIKLVTTVAQYNGFISAQATARGWAYLDPNAALDSLRTVGGTVFRSFPLFGQACTTNPFGSAFSCDAVHPSATTHRLIANKLREAINAQYNTTIPVSP
jgi:lysophospholipase L1-like esterase